MKSGNRMLDVLKLFSVERMTWTAEEASARLGTGLSTTYRYFRTLTAAGLLTPVSAAGFSLGPAIIEYDRLIQGGDPMLKTARPVMMDLILHAPPAATILLARLYGERAMCVHQVVGSAPQAPISYERGRPMPLLRGATSKIMLAHMPARLLKRLYERDHDEIARLGLGASFDAFKKTLSVIRRSGFCVARGEVDIERVAVAAPIFGLNGDIQGSLTFAVNESSADERVIRRLITLVCAGAKEIEGNMREPAAIIPADPQ